MLSLSLSLSLSQRNGLIVAASRNLTNRLASFPFRNSSFVIPNFSPPPPLPKNRRGGEGVLYLSPVCPTLPEPPPNVTVREVSETAVLVDWDPVAGADRYHVYYGTDMTKMQLFGSATASELEVRGLVEGTKYFFYVRAVNSVGESAPSNFTSRRTL